MKKYRLSNLRELSTDEQLQLIGGTNNTGCSSCSKCSGCKGEINQVIKDGVVEQVKEKKNK